ncbi:MAG: hypothetical protein LBB22_03725 [Treponema sp.]|jgi:hypothetical protein|nr:hypothetical protein [Treponema sp.]
METTQTIPEWKTTADAIWAVLNSTIQIQKETDRQIKENAIGLKELKEQTKEAAIRMKETDRQMKETDRRLGKLGNRFGEMVEYMVVPNLITKFNELNLPFTKTHRDTEIKDSTNNIFTEVDAFLENGDKVMIVEIKSAPDIDDIKDHIVRMEKLRKYADLHNDKRKYLGAIAGMVFHTNEKNYALQKGFYVIEPSGDTFNITEPTGQYHPVEW